jgi:putative restriction endonuclease
MRPRGVIRVIDTLPTEILERHRRALEWFVACRGSRQPWPAPLADGTPLATRAKGIYKPSWSEYALSVREALEGPSLNRTPQSQPDGIWKYCSYQANQDAGSWDDEFTNRGLIVCLRDRIPVGVMRQAAQEPNE